MQRAVNYRPILALIAIVFGIFFLPLRFTDGVRHLAVRSLNFFWKGLTLIPKESNEEIQNLKLENQQLKQQLFHFHTWLLFEERLQQQIEKIGSFSEMAEHSNEEDLSFFKRRTLHLSQLIEKQAQSVPATVIYRQPTHWSTSLWIDVGEKTNKTLGRTLVAKNSPVVVGSSLIGIVEKVGYTSSQVRLITDSELCPAVRAARQNEPHFLAKGILKGCSYPLWRARGQHLKGIGFNYDFADTEGPAQPLRSLDPILQIGDLLVTSGLDGIFPPDLPIATVTHITPLREGACSYELEARPLCEQINDLRTVHVLPPLNFNQPH